MCDRTVGVYRDIVQIPLILAMHKHCIKGASALFTCIIYLTVYLIAKPLGTLARGEQQYGINPEIKEFFYLTNLENSNLISQPILIVMEKL